MTATNDKTELTAEVFEASLREHAITMGAEQKAQVLETAAGPRKIVSGELLGRAA